MLQNGVESVIILSIIVKKILTNAQISEICFCYFRSY